MSPRAAIIIPHKDDQARLTRCMAALKVPDDVEVVVVDNASRAPVDAGMARLIVEAQAGAAAARNRGVAETRAPLLLFLDADCVPAADWIDVALDCGPGPVGGAVDVFHETARPLTGAQAFEQVFAFDNARYIAQDRFSVTANLVVTRAIFEMVGPFRGAVAEDRDWGLRARAAGYPVTYRADLRVAHPSRGDWASLAKKWRRLTREARGLDQDAAAWTFKALAMPLSVVFHAPKVMTAPDLSKTERLRALGTLIRLRFARMVWMLLG
ncbi:glycosyltransferase family 2 protein [Jannaschia donghaensis]|uniref:Mycofactocin system glycosyltransferase n=1 Tax=Jannaschia donghaensis TaxID=420998 RepID=A0A0M6YHA7_9RHOB|nr:glycosyltransferase [Jannaschia donghaensis]CTQ49340.1 mycofactocin system glycosyltransferase [Jannaschia donghaensis]